MKSAEGVVFQYQVMAEGEDGVSWESSVSLVSLAMASAVEVVEMESSSAKEAKARSIVGV